MSPNPDSRSALTIADHRLFAICEELRHVALDLGSEFSELINCVGIIGATRMRLRGMDAQARVWSAMVGEDGFGIVVEKTEIPVTSSTFHRPVIGGKFLEVLMPSEGEEP